LSLSLIIRAMPFVAILAALALQFLTPANQPIFGLDHTRFGQVSFGVVVLLWLLTSANRRNLAPRASGAIAAALAWLAIGIGLIAIYSYRDEFAEISHRLLAEIAPGEPEVGAGGEVIINQRMGGEFIINAKLNGVRSSLLFDTGASAVVLTADDARRAGINPVGLDYSVPVTTANGEANAAEIHLASLSVGPIVEKNVRAFVAQPGALSESLLGMTFLERLKSYGVEHGRLVLKGG
jgi:aspartyl protease family protein